jgi:integrase
MYSKTATGSASKGTMSILSFNGLLQLRFNYGDKHYYISTGLADEVGNTLNFLIVLTLLRR